ncbi:MAG: hypothetical protein M1818_008541 [Claussenomyces sp. TS43310]|nr:MAG: hypothetical protein M1818_008541 [Claussenomyces sp. TS43310]
MEITLAHHKGADRKPKPHILAIAIKDDAIQVDGYGHAAPFFASHLQHPMKAMLVRWKPEKLKMPIFRQAVSTLNGFATSNTKAMRYSTYVYYLIRLGWAAGFEQNLTCYCFRRGAGNAVDGNATTAVRDQIMRHDPNTGVFCGSYNNEKVRFIVQDAVLDQPTNAGFLRAFTHMSLTCDPRAPVDVPDEFLRTLAPDPEILELTKERDALRQEMKRRHRSIRNAAGTEIGKEYQQLGSRINALQKKRDREIKQEYRRHYFYRIHNEEMERQLNQVARDDYVEPVVQHQLPERAQLQAVLCDLSKDLSPSDIVIRRIRAIDLMVALSCRQETPRPKETSKETSPAPPTLPTCAKEESPGADPPAPDPLPLVCKKTQCIICLGNDRLTYKRRTHTFSTPEKMMNHVESHLQHVSPSQRILCPHPTCRSGGLVLNNLMHFKNHVAVVHAIKLRAS